MITRDHGEGGVWYVLAAAYPTALMARRAWERAERKLDLGAGDEGIGLMRLAPNPAGGADTGISNRHAVLAVTLDLPTARKAERLLADGEPVDPNPRFADAVIARRARIVKRHEGETGRLLIRRPEGQGAAIDHEGHMSDDRDVHR